MGQRLLHRFYLASALRCPTGTVHRSGWLLTVCKGFKLHDYLVIAQQCKSKGQCGPNASRLIRDYPAKVMPAWYTCLAIILILLLSVTF